MEKFQADRVLDCSGLENPFDDILVARTIKEIAIGQILKVIDTEPAAESEMKAWAHMTGNELLDSHQEGNKFVFFIRRVK